MAYLIICEECILCAACETECPEDAISEGEECYTIDPRKCSDCGACADICPQEAIKPGEDED